MRFEDLSGLTVLPVDHVKRRFRNEEIITVLPARADGGQHSLLVATPPKAAVVISEAPESEHWMTYWAPWESIRVVDDRATEDGRYGLTLLVGRLAFDAELRGSDGQRALRDFVVAIQSRQAAATSTNA
jgi:hypothetical protein